ncbi:hypothetical protein [Arthrobacter sp. ISL-48]|uniref:hypothetical protein n=1 Tax=Arthrobacter sp. ISL-48 TaxID=2819110 RepID=UPI00288A976E|nr:hypothetical protein [Arthrobacter sp. ISL-48]
MSDPQEPNQPGQPDAGSPPQPQPAQHQPSQQGAQHPGAQPPVPPQQPPAAPYGAPQYQGQYAAPGRYAGAGPYTAPFGLPGQEPPVKGRRKLWMILGIVGGVLLLVIVGVVILVNVVGGATNQAKGLADNFTKLVIAGDSSQAYDDYLDPALKEQLSKEEFIAGIQSLQMDDTCKPAYDNLKVSSDNGTNAADVTGLITCNNDKKIDLAYRFEGRDELKMITIKLKPKV